MTKNLHAATLHNIRTGRFHPILFRPAPRPSDTVGLGIVCRHRSAGHHTDGFQDKDVSDAYIAENSDAYWPTGIVFAWDDASGEVPAATLDLPFNTPLEARNGTD